MVKPLRQQQPGVEMDCRPVEHVEDQRHPHIVNDL